MKIGQGEVLFLMSPDRGCVTAHEGTQLESINGKSLTSRKGLQLFVLQFQGFTE